jgi:AraC-like DNA-binding protein
MLSECKTEILDINRPDAEVLRRKGIIRAVICDSREKYEVCQNNPSEHVVIFTVKGRGKLFAQGDCKDRFIKTNHMTIFPAHKPYHYVMYGNNWQGLLFYLEDDENWAVMRSKDQTIKVSNSVDELKSAMQGYLKESLQKDYYSMRALGNYAELIALILEQELSFLKERLQNFERCQSLQQLWKKVALKPQYHWTVEKLAAEMYISPQLLYKIAKLYSGRSPMDMVYGIRMKLAQDLLISTQKNVNEVSKQVGYSDSSTFSTAFKKYSGCSPRDYRIKHGKL